MIIIYILILCFSPVAVANASCSWDGDTGTAASASYSDVADCLDDEQAVDGCTIILPSGDGSATWDTTLSMSGKGITLQGQGSVNTIITDTTASGAAILIDTGGTYYTRIHGIRFKGGDSTNGAIKVQGGGINTFRIDNCQFGDTCAIGIRCYADTFGVIDNNIFNDCTIAVAINGAGDTSWSAPMSLGTSNAVYIEDNIINSSGTSRFANEAYDGARYVLRYNHISNCVMGHHDFSSNGALQRGTKSWEIYGNDVSATINMSLLFSGRGGTGLFYDNSVITSGSGAYSTTKIRLVNYRSSPWHEGIANNGSPSATTLDDSTHDFDSETYGGAVATGYIFNVTDQSSCQVTSHTTTSVICSGGLSGGSDNQWESGDRYVYTYYNNNGACDGYSSVDGNTDDAEGYPCHDQVGRGTDQTLAPVYGWNNTFDGTPEGFLVPSNQFAVQWASRMATNHIVENRDYYNCTNMADALSKSLNYTPYTYPHPLRWGDPVAGINIGSGTSTFIPGAGSHTFTPQ